MDRGFLSRFVKGVVSIGAGTMIQIGLGFLTLLLVVRYIPKDDLGVFFIIQIVAGFCATLGSLALENIAVTRLVAAAGGDEKAEIVRTAIGFKFLLSLGIGAIIFLARPLLLWIFKSETLGRLLVFIPLTLLLANLDELFQRILQGFHRYRKIAVAQIMQGGIRCLLVVGFVIWLRRGVIGLIWAYVLSTAASVLYQFVVIPVGNKASFNMRAFRKIFGFGFPLGLNTVLTFGFTRIDRFLIGALMNPVGVAQYEVGSRIPESSGRVFQSFLAVFFPNMSELFGQGRRAEAEKILNISLRLVSFVAFSSALVAVLFQDEIVRFLFSSQYLDSAPVLSILMISLGIVLIENVMGFTLVALGQSDKPFKINLMNTGSNIAGNLILIPVFGIKGAAFAALISHCLTNPLNVWFLKKGGVRIDIAQFLKPILFFGVIWGSFLLLRPQSLPIKLFMAALFPLGCAGLSVIRRSDFSNLFISLRPPAEALPGEDSPS